MVGNVELESNSVLGARADGQMGRRADEQADGREGGPCKDFYEIGPNKQIKSMIKRIDQDAFKRTENIEP